MQSNTSCEFIVLWTIECKNKFLWAKSRHLWTKFNIFWFLTPPNLARSPLRSDSIKILTKGLLHYSRKGVRMPKFRNFYRASPEISTFFSLFSYSVSWQGRRGPFPWLEDCECKRARPPRGQAWPKAGVCLWSDVGLLIVSGFLSFLWCLIWLMSGSALRALSESAVYSH